MSNTRRSTRSPRAAAFAIGLLVSCLAAAEPVTILVGSNSAVDGLCQTASLQEAINRVPAGEVRPSMILVEGGNGAFIESSRGVVVDGERRIQIVGGLGADCRPTTQERRTTMRGNAQQERPLFVVGGGSEVALRRFRFHEAFRRPAIVVVGGHLDLFDALVEQNAHEANEAPVDVLTSARLRVFGGRFSENSNLGSGGAIACAGGFDDVSKHAVVELHGNVLFSSNSAGQGGAIAVGAACIVRTLPDAEASARFVGNRATFGGAIVVGKPVAQDVPLAELAVDGAAFEQNRATSSGGAIHAQGNSMLDVVNGRFIANVGANGGAIGSDQDAQSPPIRIASSQFEANMASDRGGALYLRRPAVIDSLHCADERAFDRYCVEFRGNRATGEGGAIFASAAVSLLSAALLDNRALGRGSAIAMEGAALRLHNTLLADHTDSIGGENVLDFAGSRDNLVMFSTIAGNGMRALRVHGDAGLRLIGSLVADNRRGVQLDDGAVLRGNTCGSAAFGDLPPPVAPRFVSTARGRFRLPSDSPLRDIGGQCDPAQLQVSGFGLPERDLDQMIRSAPADAGAFEVLLPQPGSAVLLVDSFEQPDHGQRR